MSRKKTLTTKARPVHVQLLRRIIPIIVLAFVLLAGVAVVVYQDNVQTRVNDLHRVELAERTLAIIAPVDSAIGDVAALANADATRDFAVEIQSITSQRPTERPASQTEMLQLFLSLLNRNQGYYVGARFIGPDGSVWVETTNRNGIVSTNTDLQSGLLANDIYFKYMNLGTNRGMVITPITIGPASIPGTSSGAPLVVMRALNAVINPENPNRVIGIIELDISATPILDAVNNTFGENNQRWVLVNNQGRFLADSASPGITTRGLTENFYIPVNDVEPALGELLAANPEGHMDLVNFDGSLVSSTVVQVGAVSDMPWQLVLIDMAGYGAYGLYTGVAGLIAISVLGCLAAIWFISWTLRRRLEPLSAANELAMQLARGEVDDTLPPLNITSADEVGQLMAAFGRISNRLQGLSSDLEEQLNRQARNLDMAARISHETTTLADADELLRRVVDLICDEFGLYHAQVFLLDDIALNAVLIYSRGQIGEKQLSQGLKILVGSPTMVGTVTASGKSMVVNDIHDAAGVPFTPNPDLPDTRAQITLPLTIKGRVIGALDIYSSQPQAFRPDEARLLQLLADELSIAIYNTQRLSESQQRFQQVDALNRQLTRNTWQEFQRSAQLDDAYRYDLMEVQPAAPEEGVIEAISAPITIRGEVIGTIAAAAPEGMPFAQGDVAILRAVADRVGLAIENARLFKETQTSLFVTTSLYELSRYLNEAEALQDIIQAIITSAMPDAVGGQVWLFDEYPIGGRPDWLGVAADWSNDERDEQTANFLKLRVSFEDSLFLNEMEPSQVRVVTDLTRDTRLDDDLKMIFRNLGARSVVFIPFSARGQWRGLLTINFPEERTFTESEGRIFTALIDQAGVAIDNRLLIQQTELTLDQIERLYAASRIINTATTSPELVRAVVAATTDTNLNFELGLLEGPLDPSGWPTEIRKVAYSERGQVHEINQVEPLNIEPTSPLRRREPEIIIDPTDTTAFRAIFPLFSANQPIAMMVITSTAIREMSSEDYEVYHALTGQMSTVLENRRLLEQTEQALDESRRLYAASRAIASAQDSNAVYRAAAQYLSQPVDALNRISILLGGPTPGLEAAYFDYVHVWERVPDPETPTPIGLRVHAEAAPFGTLMAEVGETIYFRDIDAQLSEQNRLRQALQRANAASAIVIPLRTQRNWFGVLICESPWRDAFDEQYRRFAQAVTDQVAIAVENRVLFVEAQLEAQRALALAEVGQLATRVGAEFERNISEVFARVAQSAAYDRWLLMLIDTDRPSHLVKVSWRSPEVEDTSADFFFDMESSHHSIVDAVRQNRVILVNDPANHPSFIDSDINPQEVGKHIATPIVVGGEIVGSLTIGRALDKADMDAGDEQLVGVLAAQVAVAVENRRLFRAVESEREYLRSILDTMPTGIMVLDARTFKPLVVNAQVQNLLGKPIDLDRPFNVEDYNLLRTGTNVHYPTDELPIFVVAETGSQAFSDDIAAIHADGNQTDLLLNAAPIYDGRGNVSAIVAAFQDISNLRGLENALQNNLRETIALYEATRALSEASELEEVLDATITQLTMLEPSDGYLVLMDESTGDLTPIRGLIAPKHFNLPTTVFDTEMMLIADVRTDLGLDDETCEELKTLGTAALGVVPMRARDVLLGWIVVTFDQPRSFSPEDERFLTTLSDNAAVAIDNRNLFLRTEVAYQEAATLYETSRVLSNASTPDDIVQAVVHQMRPPFITQVFMALPTNFNADGSVETMQVVAHWQQDESTSINLMGVTLNEEQFPAWRQVSSPEMVIINDVQEEPNLTEMERLGLMSIDAHSLAVLPLRAGNRRIGVIWLAGSLPYQQGERDLRIYRSFIEQASLSLEATRLLKQTERRARQLATSAEVSQIASSILDMNVLLPRIVDLIRDAFGYDHVQIFLMDEQDNFAELKASTGEAGRQLLGINHKLAKGSASVIGTVTSTGKPAIALDTADARFIHKPNPYLPLTRSEMALPLIIQGRVVGALDVQSNQPNAFSEEDVGVLTTLANQISVALDNARLFEQSESRARDMSFLFNVTSAAANPDKTLADSLQEVADMVRNTFNALNVGVYLTETYTTDDGVSHSILRAEAVSGTEQPLSEIAEVYLGDSNNLLAIIATDMEPMIVTDAEAESRYLPIIPSARSAVAVPMTSGNQVVGVIVMEDSEPNAYTAETVNLLRALTSTLAAIVQNAQLLQEVQRSNEQLRELDRLKSDFLANMSHELRTPLNSIIGFSRVILKGIDGPLTEMQEQDLSTIYNSGTHLLNLINDILDQAKINSGKMDIHPDFFDMKSVVEGVRSIGIGLVKDKPIDLRLEVASGLPQTYGDEFRTRQVLINLVSNASKFTQQGSVTIRVYPEPNDKGQTMVRVDVQDTGIGIAEQDLPLLFEAFRQVDSSLTRTVGGTGLGLPIAKSLIEMMGGQMLVHSEVNKGSTFSILMPTEPPKDATASQEVQQVVVEPKPKTGPLGKPDKPTFDPPPRQTGILNPEVLNGHDESHTKETTETSPARDKRSVTVMPNFMPAKRQILLIEDNVDMVDQFRRTLQREGFDIFAASIPLEAEAMASGLHPTLIIMDVNFSNGMGWNILYRLRERDDTRDIPVIIVTLSAEKDLLMEAGAFTVIQRPFMPEQLIDAVRAAEAESQTERILIIDDQPESTRLLKQVLDEHGHYRVFEAHSGVEGMSMIARHRPDLVILDLRMPEMDGFAVLEELQANPETAAIPVMVVTADTLNDTEQGQLAGVDVVYKTDLGQENYRQFIDGIRGYLGNGNSDS
jgi:GAF domain-containing protein/CheY-like chemotaxis protein/HAMP domain-containing protein